MQARQISLIRESMAHLRPVAGAAGDCFYERLFDLDSTLRPLFETDLRLQGRKMMQTMEWIVAHIDRTDAFVPIVAELGRRHRDYGVKDAHYDLVRRALVGTLAQFLGADFTTEVREAWNEACAIIAHLMQASAPERNHQTDSDGGHVT